MLSNRDGEDISALTAIIIRQQGYELWPFVRCFALGQAGEQSRILWENGESGSEKAEGRKRAPYKDAHTCHFGQ